MKKLDYILIDFLQIMLDDLRRRSFDESGEQKQETLERVETLRELIKEIKNKGGE